MALFTGQQGYIPRMDMRAATLPGQLIGEGLANIGKAIERNRYDKQKKQEKADKIEATRVGIEKVRDYLGADWSDEDVSTMAKTDQAPQLLNNIYKGIEMKNEADQLGAIAAFHSQNLGQPSYESQTMQPTQGLDASVYEDVISGAMQGMYQMSPEMAAVGGIIKPEALEKFEKTPSALPRKLPTTQEELSALMSKWESPEGVKLNPKTQKTIQAQWNLPTRYEKKKEKAVDLDIWLKEQQFKNIEEQKNVEGVVSETYSAFKKSGLLKDMTNADITEAIKEKFPNIKTSQLAKEIKYYTDAQMIEKELTPQEKVAYEKALVELEKAKGRDYTEAEQKKILHAFRGNRAREILEKIMYGNEEDGYEALDFQSLGAMYENTLWDPAKGAFDSIMNSDKVAKLGLKPEKLIKLREQWQRYTANSNAWLDSLLRYESGAAIPDQELDRYRKTYFPVPGDSAKTIEDKRKIRDAVQMAMEFGLEAVVPKTKGLEGKDHITFREISKKKGQASKKLYSIDDVTSSFKNRTKVFDMGMSPRQQEDKPAVSGDVISADGGDEIELLD